MFEPEGPVHVLPLEAPEPSRETEERFLALTRATSDMVYRASADWTEIRILEGRNVLAGTPQPGNEWVETYVHPDDRPLVLETMERAVGAKSAFELEYRMNRADGTFGWMHSRAIPILDARGEIVEWFGTASDVTARKESEAASKERAAQQAAIAALSQAVLAETTLEELMGQVVDCVAQTLRAELAKVLELAPGGTHFLLRAGVGWKPGLVGRAVVGTGRDSQAGFTLLSQGPVVVTNLRTETRFTGPPLLFDHGAVSGMSCVIRRVDGEAFGVLGVHTRSRRKFSADDINFLRSVANILAAAIARRRAEAALRESERRYRRLSEQLNLVTDTMAAPVTLCSRDLVYVWASRPYAEWLGRSPHEIVGRPIVEILGREAFDKLLPRFQAVLSGQEVRYEEEADFSGLGRRWVSAVYTPVFDAAGRPDGWVAVVIDIDQRKRMEQALRESEARQAFLVRLDDALRPLADAGAIQSVAARVLGEHLGASRAMYADIEGEPGAEVGTIRSRYHGDVAQALAPFPRRFACAMFGERAMELRRRGEPMVVADVTTDPAFEPSARAAWAASGVQAAITVSLVKDGRIMAELGVQSATARAWTVQEIELVQATGERTWAAVERARAEAALREREELFRTLADNMDQLVWMADERGDAFWHNRRWRDYGGDDPSAWTEFARAHADRMARGFGSGSAWEDTFELRGRDGDHRLFLCRAVPIRDPQGSLARWFGTMTDITDLEQRNVQLRWLTAQLTATERRERRNLADALHDGLQQVLVAAKMQLPLCLEEDGGEQVRRIDRLLDEAIDVVRGLASELSPPALGISTLPEALDWLAQWFRRLHGLRVEIHAAQGLPALPEPARFLVFYAVRELLLNCAKHSGVRSARVEARMDEELRIAVSDQGTGFDPAKLAYGFGLLSMQERLLLLGGRLAIESAPGEGARFTLLLPKWSTVDSSFERRALVVQLAKETVRRGKAWTELIRRRGEAEPSQKTP